MSAEKIGPWDAENIRRARKARNLTQAELAEGLGCRQQTISEWELGMYAPKNAYQKLLTMFFGSAPVVAEAVPSQSVWNSSSSMETGMNTSSTSADSTMSSMENNNLRHLENN
ncbi:MAG: helix-turn-helix domain-containing protein [Oligoflexia bacterium]|nr:helix-turn-helix domain-containing protein [Oligoflexia bacterium]